MAGDDNDRAAFIFAHGTSSDLHQQRCSSLSAVDVNRIHKMMNFFSYLQEEAGKSKNCVIAAALAVLKVTKFKKSVLPSSFDNHFFAI
ncbi:hypothetical protein LJR030_003541 [Rhizobium sp. LjRoot30]|uniref:hypothetical protein n=1 Tax=Rhizobium sp. LjRoot30 TaxID=3342320 RepID=UPI003ECD6332